MGVGTERWVVLGEGGEHFGDELFEVSDDGSSPVAVVDQFLKALACSAAGFRRQLDGVAQRRSRSSLSK